MILVAAALAGCGDKTAAPVLQPALAPQALPIGGTMKVMQGEAAGLMQPDGAAWSTSAEYRVELTVAPPVHQSVNLRHTADAPVLPVFAQAASDGEVFYVRLRWADASSNETTSRSEFADGAAVQFALETGGNTSFMMGAANGPVNIWYWKAGREQPENLAAGGFGSTTALEQGELAAQSRYLDGEWIVVLRRPLVHEGDYQVALDHLGGQMGLAIWQGEGRQRDGLKHVTMGWLNLEAAL